MCEQFHVNYKKSERKYYIVNNTQKIEICSIGFVYFYSGIPNRDSASIYRWIRFKLFRVYFMCVCAHQVNSLELYWSKTRVRNNIQREFRHFHSQKKQHDNTSAGFCFFFVNSSLFCWLTVLTVILSLKCTHFSRCSKIILREVGFLCVCAVFYLVSCSICKWSLTNLLCVLNRRMQNNKSIMVYAIWLIHLTAIIFVSGMEK